MDNSAILDEKSIRDIPPMFTLLFILLIGIPAIALFCLSVDDNLIPNDIDNLGYLNSSITELAIRNYFIRILLEWSSLSIAIITGLLALTQYRLTHDKIARVIGLSILFSGGLETLNTLIISNFLAFFSNKAQLETLIWTLNNVYSGLILSLSLLYYINKEISPLARSSFLILILGAVCYLGVLLCCPMVLLHQYLSNPYELISIAVYLPMLTLIYPKAHQKYPSLLTLSIFYMALTQLLMAIYLMFFSYFNQEITYNIAYFIKMISYFIPFSCLLINYAFSYKTILKIQDELQISQEKFKYLAAHDELTHLYNRREFENLLDKTIANYAREHRSFAVLIIDIDDFKSINDTFGHTHGDHYLKYFSEQLSLLTRKGDIIARLGGDEFSIIMPQLNSPASARQLARRIIKGLSMPYTGNQELLSRTVSIGIAIYPCHGITSSDLLKNADLAMYQAKKSGKNSYQLPTDSQHPQAEYSEKITKQCSI